MKLPIPQDWNGTDWCRFSICWPDSPLWRGLLMGFITYPKRGRSWDEKTGIITEAQVIGREIEALNIPLQECLMACNDASELAEAIRYLADKLAANAGSSSGCCDDEAPNGSPIPTDDGIIHYGDPDNAVEEPPRDGPPPDGFETWEEYDQHKCNAAHAIVDGLITMFRSWAFWNDIKSIVVGGVIALAPLFITIPPAAAVVLVGALVAIFASRTLWANLADEMEENKQDIVCGLYNALTSFDAIDWLVEKLTIMADEIFPTILQWPLHQAIAAAISIETVQILFVEQVLGYDNQDCSACGPGTGPYTVVMGTETTENPSNPIDIDPDFIGVEDCLEVMINFHEAVSITEIGFGGGSEDQNFDSCGAFNRFWYYSSEDQVDLIFSSNGFPHQNVVPTGVRSVYIRWEGHDIAGNWEPGFVTVFYSIDE